MKAATTLKQNRRDNNSKRGNARKARTTTELLEKALSMASAADIELKALFKGMNDEFGRLDIIYPNY